MDIFDRIDLECKNKGIKKSDLCERLGKDISYLSQLKRGRILLNDAIIKDIAGILDVSVDYLNGKTDIKKAPPPNKDDEEIFSYIKLLNYEQKKSLLVIVRSMVNNESQKASIW